MQISLSIIVSLLKIKSFKYLQQIDHSVSFSCRYFSSSVTPQAYPQHLNISPSPVRPERSGVRGHRRRSFSMEHHQSSVSSALTRAITAARHMREASQRMARSIHTASCSYWHTHTPTSVHLANTFIHTSAAQLCRIRKWEMFVLFRLHKTNLVVTDAM